MASNQRQRRNGRRKVYACKALDDPRGSTWSLYAKGSGGALHQVGLVRGPRWIVERIAQVVTWDAILDLAVSDDR